MAKKEKISFLIPKEDISKLDNFLKVETEGEEMYVLTRSDFFRILMNDAFQKYDHVLDYLKDRRKKAKKGK